MTTVEIVETTLRDGLQNEATILSTDQKVELARQLTGFGARRIEVTSFVNPKRVPQMADADELMSRLGNLGARLSALAMNERGLDRALQAGVDEVNIVVVATDTFCQRNQGTTTRESLDTAAALVTRARSAGVFTTVTVGASFGCPFEGEVTARRLRSVLERASSAGPDELALADTIGVAVPADIDERIAIARDVTGGAIPLRLHLHDTRHTAVANALAALDSGVTTLDATVGGAGGCPFAPRATGNVAIEDLVYALHRTGIPTGLDLDRVRDSTQWLEAALGKRLPGALLRAGGFPTRDHVEHTPAP